MMEEQNEDFEVWRDWCCETNQQSSDIHQINLRAHAGAVVVIRERLDHFHILAEYSQGCQRSRCRFRGYVWSTENAYGDEWDWDWPLLVDRSAVLIDDELGLR